MGNQSPSDSQSLHSSQEHEYDELNAPVLLNDVTTMTSLSMTADQEHCEQEIITPSQSQTVCGLSDDENHDQDITTILPQEWLPLATSTPLSLHSPEETTRSEQEIVNDLFTNIEQLVRTFVNRPNRQYPYYRVMRWTTGEPSNIEHFVTVVINRPTISS